MEEALQHLQQLVQQQPGNYEALAQLLLLLRRAGRAEQGGALLENARRQATRTAGAAGRSSF